MIKPEYWDDEKLATISRDARLTYIAMWNFSDDYGVVKGHYNWLKNIIFPYDCNLKIDDFVSWLKELEKLDRIRKFKANNERYYFMPQFLKHQKINRPSDRHNPFPPKEVAGGSLHAHGILTDEVKRKEKKRKEYSVKFLQFYSFYPIKKSKEQAWKSWQKLENEKRLPEVGILLKAIEDQKQEREHKLSNNKFCPEWKHPSTWLNGSCWADEAEKPYSVKPKYTTPEKAAELHR
jgi:hypothetical protein